MKRETRNKLIAIVLIIAILGAISYFLHPFVLQKTGRIIRPDKILPPKQVKTLDPNDSRWRSQSIGETEFTIASTGNPTILVTLALQNFGYNVSPTIVNASLNQHNVYNPEGNLIWELVSKAYPEIQLHKEETFNSQTVTKDIEAGLLPIVKVNNKKGVEARYVMIVGSNKEDFLIVDPSQAELGVIPLKQSYKRVYSYLVFTAKDTIIEPWTVIDESTAVQSINSTINGSSSTIHIYRLADNKFIPEIKHKDTPQIISKWQETIERSRDYASSGLIINGGFFEKDYQPSGLLIIDGNRVGSNNLNPEISGILTINDNSIDIIDSNEFNEERCTITSCSAIQSFPIIIKDNEINISTEWKKPAQRSAIGYDNESNLYLIVTQGNLSLHELAVKLKESDIRLDDVLNLDGGTSTGISVVLPATNYSQLHNSYKAVPNVLLFTPKNNIN